MLHGSRTGLYSSQSNIRLAIKPQTEIRPVIQAHEFYAVLDTMFDVIKPLAKKYKLAELHALLKQFKQEIKSGDDSLKDAIDKYTAKRETVENGKLGEEYLTLSESKRTAQASLKQVRHQVFVLGKAIWDAQAERDRNELELRIKL